MLQGSLGHFCYAPFVWQPPRVRAHMGRLLALGGVDHNAAPDPVGLHPAVKRRLRAAEPARRFGHVAVDLCQHLAQLALFRIGECSAGLFGRLHVTTVTFRDGRVNRYCVLTQARYGRNVTEPLTGRTEEEPPGAMTVELLRYANREKVAQALTEGGYRVSRNTVNRWARGDEAPPIVHRMIAALFGHDPDRRPSSDVATILSAIEVNRRLFLEAVAAQYAELAALLRGQDSDDEELPGSTGPRPTPPGQGPGRSP